MKKLLLATLLIASFTAQASDEKISLSESLEMTESVQVCAATGSIVKADLGGHFGDMLDKVAVDHSYEIAIQMQKAGEAKSKETLQYIGSISMSPTQHQAKVKGDLAKASISNEWGCSSLPLKLSIFMSNYPKKG